ncbi:MAG: HlyD family efflux transporter periplasmic adaptor subunit [Alphaproteobacteria bacterium]|nr:HlyD family efflux transporter periplasmic adaptor subunit [Alphaproteobacteria bacterium]
MPSQFSQTTRSLANDRSIYVFLAWMLGGALLAAWGAWFVLGQVTIYETSRKARLEVEQLPHHVSAQFPGKIAAVSLVIGREVNAGDVLIELDASVEMLRLKEEEARLAALPPRLESLRKELASVEQARAEDRRAAQAAIDAARARAKEAEAAVEFARNSERRLREQSSAGGVAQIEALRALAETQKLGAARDALVAEARRNELDAQTRAHQSQAQLENIRRALLTIEGDMVTTRATIARLQRTIEQHVVRAPVAGRIGEVAPLHADAYVTEGQRLATIVPPGELIIVADFDPGSALGRVQPGQRGRMRLDGFPWAQFGSIEARVSRVASEIRDNLVRVEFVPATDGVMPAMIQHGLPGAIEVAIEDTTPASLLLRAAGLMLSGPKRPAARPGETAR